MRIPLLLDADKSITQSAQTYLRKGKWKFTCDDVETTFSIITSENFICNYQDFDHEGGIVRAIIDQRGKAFKINIYAERL